jgi:hypothetical protein
VKNEAVASKRELALRIYEGSRAAQKAKPVKRTPHHIIVNNAAIVVPEELDVETAVLPWPWEQQQPKAKPNTDWLGLDESDPIGAAAVSDGEFLPWPWEA